MRDSGIQKLFHQTVQPILAVSDMSSAKQCNSPTILPFAWERCLIQAHHSIGIRIDGRHYEKRFVHEREIANTPGVLSAYASGFSGWVLNLKRESLRDSIGRTGVVFEDDPLRVRVPFDNMELGICFTLDRESLPKDLLVQPELILLRAVSLTLDTWKQRENRLFNLFNKKLRDLMTESAKLRNEMKEIAEVNHFIQCLKRYYAALGIRFHWNHLEDRHYQFDISFEGEPEIHMIAHPSTSSGFGTGRDLIGDIGKQVAEIVHEKLLLGRLSRLYGRPDCQYDPGHGIRISFPDFDDTFLQFNVATLLEETGDSYYTGNQRSLWIVFLKAVSDSMDKVFGADVAMPPNTPQEPTRKIILMSAPDSKKGDRGEVFMPVVEERRPLRPKHKDDVQKAPEGSNPDHLSADSLAAESELPINNLEETATIQDEIQQTELSERFTSTLRKYLSALDNFRMTSSSVDQTTLEQLKAFYMMMGIHLEFQPSGEGSPITNPVEMTIQRVTEIEEGEEEALSTRVSIGTFNTSVSPQDFFNQIARKILQHEYDVWGEQFQGSPQDEGLSAKYKQETEKLKLDMSLIEKREINDITRLAVLRSLSGILDQLLWQVRILRDGDRARRRRTIKRERGGGLSDRVDEGGDGIGMGDESLFAPDTSSYLGESAKRGGSLNVDPDLLPPW